MSDYLSDINKSDKDPDWVWVDVNSETEEVLQFEEPIQTARSFIESLESFRSLPSLIEHEEKKAARRRASNPVFQRIKISREPRTKIDRNKVTPDEDDGSDASSGETCSLSSLSETFSLFIDGTGGFYFDKSQLLPLIEAESSSEEEEVSAPVSEIEVEVIMPTINHLGGVGQVEEAEDEEPATELDAEVEHTEKVSFMEFLGRDELTLAAVCTVFLFGSMWALEQGRGPTSVFIRPI